MKLVNVRRRVVLQTALQGLLGSTALMSFCLSVAAASELAESTPRISEVAITQTIAEASIAYFVLAVFFTLLARRLPSGYCAVKRYEKLRDMQEQYLQFKTHLNVSQLDNSNSLEQQLKKVNSL